MQDPTSLAWLFGVTGSLLILSGLIGGGFQLKDIHIPRLGNLARISSVIVGSVLIGVAVFLPQGEGGNGGEDDPNGDSEIEGTGVSGDPSGSPEPTVDPPSPAGEVEVPSLDGALEPAARRALQDAGLEVGIVTQRVAWAAAGEVLEQRPAAGSQAQPGAAVDLVLADSVLRFRAHRAMTSQGETSIIEADYRLELSRAADTGELVGEFRLSSVRFEPDDGDSGAQVRDLIDQPGYLQLDQLGQLDVSLAWPAYGRLTRDLETELARGAGGEEPDFSGVGTAMWMVMVGPQVAFDVRTMFTPMPRGGDPRNIRLELQEATAILSRIQVRGPASVAGSTRLLQVHRKKGEQPERTVGSASYDIETGILRELDMSYDSNDDLTYRLRITRQ